MSALYLNYFQNGLSDGACAGKRMHDLSYKIKYIFREPNRIRRVSHDLKMKFGNYDFLKNPMLSNNAFSGRHWMFKYRDFDIPIELSDPVFLFEYI